MRSASGAPPVIDEMRIGARSRLPKNAAASEMSLRLISGSA
jgi:hypothetical protein